jgi:hypothetical protein
MAYFLVYFILFFCKIVDKAQNRLYNIKQIAQKWLIKLIDSKKINLEEMFYELEKRVGLFDRERDGDG